MDAHLAFRGVGGPRLHLGVCGSVAAYRALDLVRQWQDAGVSVSATLTPSAQKFVTPLTFAALGAAPVYTAPFDDPQAPSPFAHLEPGQVAQALVIAPASAATIARLAQGQADDLLACQALAFRGKAVIAPAMNPAMWSHPATQANIATLRERGCAVVEPGCGRTACGEEGQGRLADLREIYLAGLRALAPQDMEGIRVMVTLGPTREHWDGLRFWTNPSTGTMGAAVAVAAWLRGARVEAVCGPGTPWLPAGIARHNVGSARHMLEAAASVWPQCDAGVFTVADFSPVPPAQGGDKKFKKSDAPDGFDVHFAPNPDILKTLAADRRPEQKVVGFAAESQNLEDSVRGKLVSKKADMVVGNLLQDGFGTPDNTVFVADASGREERWAHLSKTDVAWRLLSWLLSPAFRPWRQAGITHLLLDDEVRERLLARPEPEPSEAAPPVRQHSAPPQRGERRQPQPPSYTPPPQPQPVSSAPQKPVRIADTDTLAPDVWPAYWQTLLKKTPPRPSLVWSYPSLSRDLGGDADAAHRDFLRRLLGDMALPKGSHAFWPLNRYPYGDGESEQTVDARMFLSGIAALKPESVILMCGQVPPELGLAELRPLSPSIVHGHRYVVTPHVDDLIGEPQRYAQLITFLKSIIAGR